MEQNSPNPKTIRIKFCLCKKDDNKVIQITKIFSEEVELNIILKQ